MKIIKLLKRIVKELLNDKPEVKSETIKFSQVNDWIKNKEKEIKIKEKEIAKSIKEKLSLFIVELNKKSAFLEHVNLDKVNEDNRTKHIVLTNLKEYIRLVENLLNELEDFNSLDFPKLNNLINSSFSNFNKVSHAKYQKATYLIGKELGDVNQCIHGFLRAYSKIIKENEEITNTSSIIHITKEKLDDFEENSEENKINSNIKQIKTEITSSKQKINQYSAEIKNVEHSKTHIENLKNIKRKEELQLELNKDVIDLKQSIDFKALTKIFHGSAKYWEIVKNFREKFDESFKHDNGKTLLSLLDESRLNNETIVNKIKVINDKLQEMESIKSKPEDDEIQIVKEKIKKIEYEIDNSNEEIDKELKRSRRINDSQENIRNSIRQELSKLNVTIDK